MSEAVDRAVMRFDALTVALAVANVTRGHERGVWAADPEQDAGKEVTLTLCLGTVRQAWRVAAAMRAETGQAGQA